MILTEDEINALFDEFRGELTLEQHDLKAKMKLTHDPTSRVDIHYKTKFNIRKFLTMNAYSNRMKGLTEGYHYLCNDKIHELAYLYRGK